MNAATAIEHVITLSQELGSDITLVQGGGGNISVKTDDGEMYIKASGTALKNMSQVRGVVGIDSTGQVHFGKPQRPSMEWPMHVALPTRSVLHTHSVYVNVFGCMIGGDEQLHVILAGMQYLILPYLQPGQRLAAGMTNAVAQYQHERGQLPEIIILRNHGLLIAHNDPTTALQLTTTVHQRCQDALREFVPNFPPFVTTGTNDATAIAPTVYYFPDAAVFGDGAATADNQAIWAANHYIETMIQNLGGIPQPLTANDDAALRAMETEQYRIQLNS